MQQASKYIDDDKITISPWLLGWLGPENVSCNKNNSVRDYQDWGVISKYPSIVKELEIFLYQPQYCKDHYDHSPDNQGSAVLPSKIHSQCIRASHKNSECSQRVRIALKSTDGYGWDKVQWICFKSLISCILTL